MRFRFCLFFLTTVFALPVWAFDAASIGQSVVSDWQGWMEKHGISEGALVVAYEGEVVATGEMNRTIDEPAKVASLSKAITAICALKAADQSGTSPMARLADVMPGALAAHPPSDARMADIRLGQLITHQSGIASIYHRSELQKLKTFEKENKLWQFSKVAREALTHDPGTAPYAYSNANYLLLGLAIEEMTGEGYEAYCKREVLEPLDVETAGLAQSWRVMSSWGGWEISARDYLTFAEAYFGGDTSPTTPGGYFLSAASLERGRSYGAGLLFRRTESGATLWHQGSWRGVRGRVSDPFGAYVALYDNGFSVVTNYAHDAFEREISGELDSLLYKGTHP